MLFVTGGDVTQLRKKEEEILCSQILRGFQGNRNKMSGFRWLMRV